MTSCTISTRSASARRTRCRPRTAAASIDALIKQVASPVRWEQVVQRLASEGVTRYVEVGPGKALSGMIKRIASGATIQNVEGPDDLAAIEAQS